MNQPFISVIIPACNEEKYLEKTLRSIHEQDYPHTETIVVANGCADNTTNVAAKHADRVIELKDANVGKARNAGAAQAKGELLIFLDADTTLSVNSLSLIAQRWQPSHAVGTLKAAPEPPRLKYRFIMAAKNLYHGLRLYYGSSGIIITSKEVFSSVKFPELKVKENRQFITEALKHGRYFYLSDAVATTSMRRFESWGILGTCGFWVLKWFKSLGNRKKLETEEYEPVR